ncbi:MAG: hypothetical protein KAS71_10670 [Bacteroidales bacterium]|nr:hypothetical protein [Bacteroidales bacterium]
MEFAKFFIILFFFMFGCDDDPGEIKNKGEITLSSEFQGSDNYYYRYGYSFEKAKFFVVLPVYENEIPDVFLEDIPIPGSESLASFIYSEASNLNGIIKNGDFNNLNEAETFYNAYDNAVSGPWSSLSDTIESFQVYTFKTSVNNYVKLLVLDVRLFDNLTTPDYMEIDLRYFIQRDGTINLAE